jgi:uncharacterized protein YndB with AHSA1/START domain
MARRHVLIQRPPESVWAVLSDGERYADWVVGTHETKQADDHWPRPGAAIRYTVKLGPPPPLDRLVRPRTLHNQTVVRDSERPRRLELEAQAGPLGAARISVEIQPWGGDSLVTVDEHPISGPGARWHNAVLDMALMVRHRHMLDRLAATVENADARR